MLFVLNLKMGIEDIETACKKELKKYPILADLDLKVVLDKIGLYIIKTKVFKKSSFSHQVKTYGDIQKEEFDTLWNLLKKYCIVLFKEKYDIDIESTIQDDELSSYLVLYYCFQHPSQDITSLEENLQQWIRSVLGQFYQQSSVSK